MSFPANIMAGGVPPCSLNVSNTVDVVSSEPMLQKGQAEPQIDGVTPIVRPSANQENSKSIGCGCTGTVIKASSADSGKTKEEIIAEVVRRVTEQISAGKR